MTYIVWENVALFLLCFVSIDDGNWDVYWCDVIHYLWKFDGKTLEFLGKNNALRACNMLHVDIMY